MPAAGARHPLANKGTKVGAQVYREDLLDMTAELNSIIEMGIPEFQSLPGLVVKQIPGSLLSSFQDLVTPCRIGYFLFLVHLLMSRNTAARIPIRVAQAATLPIINPIGLGFGSFPCVTAF